MQETNIKWYDSKIFVYVLLIFFFPVGCILLWINRRISDGAKCVYTGIYGIIFFAALIFIFVGEPKISSLVLRADNCTLEVGNYKDIKIDIFPYNADDSELMFFLENDSIVGMDKKYNSSNMYARINAKEEGHTTIYIKDKRTKTISNKISVTVKDTKKEEARKLEQEKQEQIKRQEDANRAKEITQRSDNKKETVQQSNNKKVDNYSKSNPNNESTHTIYITRTGKKYHYNNHCNSGTYYKSTLQDALNRGLGPCQKCVK